MSDAQYSIRHASDCRILFVVNLTHITAVAILSLTIVPYILNVYITFSSNGPRSRDCRGWGSNNRFTRYLTHQATPYPTHPPIPIKTY